MKNIFAEPTYMHYNTVSSMLGMHRLDNTNDLQLFIVLEMGVENEMKRGMSESGQWNIAVS